MCVEESSPLLCTEVCYFAIAHNGFLKPIAVLMFVLLSLYK